MSKKQTTKQIRTAATFLFLALALTGCGADSLRATGEFEHYVQSFELAAAAAGHPQVVSKLVIRFVETIATNEAHRTAAGSCRPGDIPTIEINSTLWKTLPEDARERLLFHEIGHCILHKGHTAEAGHIMSPILELSWSDNKAGLLAEYFR